jgi:drug/metabolite transporter (DMT)-like permease
MLILAGLAIVWGSSFILMKRGLAVFAPVQVAALRVTISCLVLLPVAFVAVRSIDRSYWKYLALCGLLGNGLPALLFCTAQTGINSSTAGLLNAMTPVFTLLVGMTFFYLKPARVQIAGVGLGFVGAITLVLAASKEAPSGNPLYGLLVVAATICYGVSGNIISRYLKHLNALHANALFLVPIAVPYVLYLLLSNFSTVLTTSPDAWPALGYVALLAVVGTALSNTLYTYLMKISSLLFASSVTYLIPITALVWGIADSERIGALHLVGITIILAGVYLVNRKK